MQRPVLYMLLFLCLCLVTYALQNGDFEIPGNITNPVPYWTLSLNTFAIEEPSFTCSPPAAANVIVNPISGNNFAYIQTSMKAQIPYCMSQSAYLLAGGKISFYYFFCYMDTLPDTATISLSNQILIDIVGNSPPQWVSYSATVTSVGTYNLQFCVMDGGNDDTSNPSPLMVDKVVVDADGDGVPDSSDACPYGNPVVNLTLPTDPQPTNSVTTVSVTISVATGSASLTVNWGDGSIISYPVTLSGTTTLSFTHTYTSPGLYSPTVTAYFTGNGCSSVTVTASSSSWIVIYSPSGVCVIGGSYFNSPAGAYRPVTSSHCIAGFGLLARLKSGSSVPTGNFNLLVAPYMLLSSTSFIWLIISSSQTQLMGVGIINNNNAVQYGFLIATNDAGNPPPLQEIDSIRIRVWNMATNAVIYDTNPSASNTYTPADDNLSGPYVAVQGGIIIQRTS